MGSGSGYLTVLLADMVRPGGLAVGIEHIPQLVERSREAATRIPWAADMLRNGSLILTEVVYMQSCIDLSVCRLWGLGSFRGTFLRFLQDWNLQLPSL